MRFSGRRVAVIGGGTSWGSACASRLAREGGRVAVIDRDPALVDDVVEALRADGLDADGWAVDPGSEAEMSDTAQFVAAAFGGLDVLVTCYMDLDWSSVESSDIPRFTEVVVFNLVGPVIATKAFLPLLKASASASVVHVGSIDGFLGNPHVASYSASKGGLVPLTHVMAHEFARYGIRVNAVASGQTNQVTGEMVLAPSIPTGSDPMPDIDYYRRLASNIPLARTGSPEEWAGPVAFLASDDASYVTGSVLTVDCGRTAITHGTSDMTARVRP